jgi:hypothetical protein
MNKRGQFFLIAAIIIIGLVVGLATAVNSAAAGDSHEAFYDLAGEVGFETKRVLDYGAFSGTPSTELMKDFLEEYTNYIAQDEVLFIFGDSTGLLEAFVFKVDDAGNVGIDTEGFAPNTVTIQYTTQDTADLTVVNGEVVVVVIQGIEHRFPLRDGQNFFLVLGKEENGEKFVAKG